MISKSAAQAATAAAVSAQAEANLLALAHAEVDAAINAAADAGDDHVRISYIGEQADAFAAVKAELDSAGFGTSSIVDVTIATHACKAFSVAWDS